MPDRIRVAVLGATGLVGQWMIHILSGHPWFEVEVVAASPRAAGVRYAEAVNWVLPVPIPEEVAELKVVRAEADAVKGVDLVLSALPSDVAAPVEVELARKGLPVVSNASPMRLEDDVPLLNPEVNWDHMKLIEVQRKRRGWRGFIAKNPNCTTAILTLTLKPLMDSFGLKRVFVTTMQAVSGAGLEGVASVKIIDNVIPYIKGEEEKVVRESKKILGRLEGGRVRPAGIEIAATCTRVPVLDGHLESVYAFTEKDASVEEVVRVLEEFKGLPQEKGLPTAPQRPVVVRRGIDRPQPRLDRMEGKGMGVVVGRVRKVEGGALAYLVLGHNLVRGAAGVAVLVAEALHSEGFI